MTAPTITEFIAANLARIEQVAREATPGPWRWEEPSAGDWPDGDESLVSDGKHTPGGHPETVLYGWGYDASGIEGRDEDRAHIALHDPAHVLAWVAGLRAVVEMHRTWADDPWPECEVCRRPPPCPTIRAIACIFADQPGYDEGWRA